MDGKPRSRRRWTLGALMGAIAVLAVVFSAFRHYMTPATWAATRILRQNGPALGPQFNPGHYLADSVVKTPSGDWRVHFTRIGGAAAPEYDVMVPDDIVRKARPFHW